jgi:CHAD domain-containing protein
MALDQNRLVRPVNKLNKLVKKVGSKPTPTKIHDLRTSTRRFEAMFQALALDSQGIRKSTVKDLGRFRKRAGKVRDMDVLTAYAASVHPRNGEEECAVQLLELLGARRRKYAKKLYADVHRRGPDMRSDLKRIPALVAKLTRNADDSPGKNGVAPNAAATAVKLAVQLAVPERLGRETLHPYRLKLKELLYVLQLAVGASEAKFVNDLREVKDAIGEWHDWEELALIAKETLNHGTRCGLVAELKHTAKDKYEHALALAETLREKYLQGSPPQRKGPSHAKVPGNAVWQAIATLAG